MSVLSNNVMGSRSRSSEVMGSSSRSCICTLSFEPLYLESSNLTYEYIMIISSKILITKVMGSSSRSSEVTGSSSKSDNF